MGNIGKRDRKEWASGIKEGEALGGP